MKDPGLAEIALAVIAAGSTIIAASIPERLKARFAKAKTDQETEKLATESASLARGSFIDDASDVVKLYRDAVADLRANSTRLEAEILTAAEQARDAAAEIARLRREVAALRARLPEVSP